MEYYLTQKGMKSVTCYNMDELEGLYAKRNKPATTREILYEFHLDELSRAIKIIEKVERWLPGAGGERKMRSRSVGTEFQGCKMKTFWRFNPRQCEYA